MLTLWPSRIADHRSQSVHSPQVNWMQSELGWIYHWVMKALMWCEDCGMLSTSRILPEGRPSEQRQGTSWRTGNPGVRFCKPERYLWKPLWPTDISAGDIFGPESVSVKIYYGWNTCWATSPNPPGKISFRDVFKERYLFLQKCTPGLHHIPCIMP